MGPCTLALKDLRDLPDSILESLGGLLKCMMVQIIGPEGAACWLHLLEKKKGGFRTIATFTSLWRLVMAAASSDFKAWAADEADAFDIAQAGGKPTLHLLRRSCSMEASTWLGHAWAAALWDISTFFEAVSPRAMQQAVA